MGQYLIGRFTGTSPAHLTPPGPIKWSAPRPSLRVVCPALSALTPRNLSAILCPKFINDRTNSTLAFAFDCTRLRLSPSLRSLRFLRLQRLRREWYLWEGVSGRFVGVLCKHRLLGTTAFSFLHLSLLGNWLARLRSSLDSNFSATSNLLLSPSYRLAKSLTKGLLIDDNSNCRSDSSTAPYIPSSSSR